MLCRQEHEGLKSGEGSWNVAWDARPARWLHHPDSAWLLFGACPLLDFDSDVNCKVSAPADDSVDGFKTNAIMPDSANPGSSNYRVTGKISNYSLLIFSFPDCLVVILEHI